MSRALRFLGLLLVLTGFAYAAMMSSRLPDRVASHWDAAGRVNGTMPKPWGVFIVPIVMLVLWGLFQVLPRMSPRGYEMESFATPWAVLTDAVLAFMLFVEVLTLRAAETHASLSPRPVIAAVGILFAIIGATLTRFSRNFFAGIRTPWTLASEEVWNRTHRVGSRVFVVTGLWVAAAALLDLGWWAMLAPLLLGGLIPVVYSYVIYRHLNPRTQT
ncbi:MAG TPA: SdpI family protein [Thermoanaerobaculia bacterium]|nr:SdpI family protein [Thermoanaerobaculia bacterium]